MNFVKTGAILAFGLTSIATSAVAQTATATGDLGEVTPVQLVEDIGAAERLEFSALLSVLSQETASAACHLSHDVNPAESKELLQEAITKFDKILDALQHGNPDMNIIGAEPRRKTIAEIEALRDQWAPMNAAAKTLLDEPKDADALKLIKAQNEALLKATDLLTDHLAAEYSNPVELLQSDVLLLQFTARQAMLTQKMAKIGCEIWVGNRAQDRIDLLTSIMQTYDLTLTALHDGMPAVGIKPAPTPEIEQALTKAQGDWIKIKAELDIILAGDAITDEVKAELYHDLNVAMYDMENIEHMFVENSKNGFAD